MSEDKKPDEDEKDSTPFDSLLKNLVDHFAPDLMVYLGGWEGIESWETVGGEVEIMHRLSDRAWRVTQKQAGQEEKFLFHLEFESGTKSNMGGRVGMYGWGLHVKEGGLPVYSMVWYVGDKSPTGWPKGEWKRKQQEEMKIGREVGAWVSWWEVWLPGKYRAEPFAKEAPVYLLPFAVMMPDMNKPLLSRLKEQIMDSGVETGQKQDLLAMLVFFACRKFELKEVMEVITMDLFTNNPLVAYLKEKFTQEGEQKGKLEGKLEGKCSLLQSLAKKRFPHISVVTLQLLESLDEEALEQVGESILDIPNGREFRQLLLQLQPEPSDSVKS